VSVSAAERFARPVLEAALAQARRDAQDETAPAPPKALHPYLNFSRVPDRALTAAWVALGDDGFRQRVRQLMSGDELDEALATLLDRPDGWQTSFDAAAEAWSQSERAGATMVEAGSARRRLDAATAATRRLTAELADSQQALTAEQQRRAALADELETVREALSAADERSEAAVAQRARAIRELKDTERRLAAKTTELRQAVEAQHTAAKSEPPPPPSPPRPIDAASELAAIRAALAALARSVDDLDARLRGPSEPVTATQAAARTRRPAPRLSRGLVDGTVDAVAARLTLPGVLVLVDGWNVGMSGWAQLDQHTQRNRVVDGLSELAVRHRCEIHVVFDGLDDGSAASRVGAGRVRVHFTREGVEADDRILELIDAVPLDRPVVVVSSDQRVQSGSRDRNALVLGSEEMVLAIGGPK